MFKLERRDRCPACSTAADVLLDLPYGEPPISDYLRGFYRGRIEPESLGRERYVLMDCGGCGLIYQLGVPGPDLLSQLYDDATGIDPDPGRRARGFQDRRSYAFQVEEMLKFLDIEPSDVDVLDYGMGWGAWLQMALAFGCRATGAELSTSRADAPVPGIDVVAYDSLPAERFHFVNTEQVFEHLNEPLTTARRLVESLAPGGIFRISVPNGGNIRPLLQAPDWNAPKGTRRSLNAVAPLEHVNCFSHETLRSFARQLGLRPFSYPVKQFIEPWERIRFAASAVVHLVRPPRGTMLLFRKDP